MQKRGSANRFSKKDSGLIKRLAQGLAQDSDADGHSYSGGNRQRGTIITVITDSEKKHQYAMNNFTRIPSYAMLDPKAAYTLPPHLTATTSMDALAHAGEAYIDGATGKEIRGLSLEAIKFIFEKIEIAYKDGTSHQARESMLTAAYKAGIAF